MLRTAIGILACGAIIWGCSHDLDDSNAIDVKEYERTHPDTTVDPNQGGTSSDPTQGGNTSDPNPTGGNTSNPTQGGNTSAKTFMEFALQKYDTNQNGEIDSAEAQGVSEINCAGQGITSLSGVEKFFNLENLNASNNALTSVTLSGDMLVALDLSNNQLTQLDISGCTNLSMGTFNSTGNPKLTCVKVNANQESMPKRNPDKWKKDDITTFSAFCN